MLRIEIAQYLSDRVYESVLTEMRHLLFIQNSSGMFIEGRYEYLFSSCLINIQNQCTLNH